MSCLDGLFSTFIAKYLHLCLKLNMVLVWSFVESVPLCDNWSDLVHRVLA